MISIAGFVSKPSFSTSVERYLCAAADDPRVRGVKMTLYRTSGKGRIIGALVRAACNGKQVVELKCPGAWPHLITSSPGVRLS